MCKTFTRLLPCVLLLLAAGLAQADLAGHWKLDEGSGTTAFDSSGNGNDGTITDNSDLENVAWIAGVSGTALEFHGVGVVFTGGDYVDCGNDASLDITGPISIALWIRPDADDPEGKGTAGGETAPMAKADSGVGWSWQVRYGWGSGRLPYMGFQFAVGGSGTWVHVDRNLERYEWCHVACSHDGTTVRCYLNGEETDSTPLGQIDSSPAPVLIGSDGWLCDWTGGIDDVRIYNHGLTPEEILDAMLASGGPELAADPVPETEATDVPRDVVLGWSAGEFAATHDVYLGTVFTDVNDASHANPMGVLVSEGQAASTYDPEGPLEFGQTYYWRIDEVNAAPDNTIFKGLVWSFTVEPLGYPIENITATSNATSGAGEGPENTINGSGLNESDQHSTAAPDMWLGVPAGADPVYLQYEFDKVYKLHEMLVWNYNVEFELVLGFGLRNVAVEYSVDGADWTALGDAEFAQATARKDYVANTTVDFGGVAAKYVKLTVNSGHGMLGQFGLSEVRFLSVPVQAREPQPADGATDVLADTTLSWRAGREAASHDVYLGTDPEALVLADSVGEASYTPGDLEFGSTYYWQIVEVNEAEAISSWASDVWSFATQEYAVIDDFESYDDEENRIYDTWLDGFVNGTGATVGYFEAPFAEQTIVNSGSQSMPLEYNNADAPFYSEAEVDLGSMNWDTNGADTLAVNFRGNGPEFLETADGRIIMNSIGADVWGTADQFRYAYKRLSGDGSIIALVENVVNSWGWAKAGVMIRESLDPGSAHAMTVVTPANGVALQYRPVMNQASFNVNETGLEAPYWVKLTRVGNTFTAERSEDGVAWVSITADAAAASVDIDMGANVYIGLMSVSTRAAIVGGAEFSNISTTGTVTGDWETAGIGVEQPAGNDPEALYVAVEDSSGNVAVVTHPDPLAVLTMEWQEWQIPFADLAGVNLSRVAIMYIGVGDRDNPSAGGTGLIYVDDIGYGRPLGE